MRVPPPGLLKLDRKTLLRDVAERLAGRLPARRPDPADPAWMLLEQAAWLVELLSEQLDRYPFAVVQQLLHLLGGHLRPAHPAIGAVVAQVSRPGPLDHDPDLPAPWRFYTPQSERREAIEFAPAERGVTLSRGAVAHLALIREGELCCAGRGGADRGTGALVAARSAPRRSSLFDYEQIKFIAMTNNATALLSSLREAVAKVKERHIGWLRLEVRQVASEQVALIAEVAPGGAFARTAPGGVWTGGDLLGDWGTLDDSTWTPPVRVADAPMLPRRLRGSRPLPSAEEGRILLPDVPADTPTAALLCRSAAPVPAAVVEAIWATVAAQDARLLALRPSISRSFAAPAEAEEPGWVAGALERGLWPRLAGPGAERLVAEVALPADRDEARAARIGVVLADADPDHLPAVQIYGLDAQSRPDPEPLFVATAWTLPAPPPDGGRGLWHLVAFDAPLAPEHRGLLVVCEGAVEAVMLNPLLVVNAPVVRDGRRWTVQRNVPETVSALFQDLVSPDVLRLLLAQPLPADTAAVLAGLPLSRLAVEGDRGVADFAGVSVDPSEGTLTWNAPDSQGQTTTLRPGARLRLDWYRRTDGRAGQVPAGAISLVEQERDRLPSIAKVSNPLPTIFGADRESAEEAIDRMAAPTSGLPVLPGDFERVVRQALGQQGEGWLVRCWTYAERALLSTALWPPAPGAEALASPGEPETERLRAALATAGPEQLLVAVGPAQGGLDEAALDQARAAIRREIRALSHRLPVIKDAVVTRLWPLTLQPGPEDEAPAKLPCFALPELAGALLDERGRRAPPPRAELLLNAAVVAIRRGEAP